MTAPAAATRAVVTDPPGEPTTVTLYGDDGALASVVLDPATCVGLAADLLGAARIRLGRWAPESSASHQSNAEGKSATTLAKPTTTTLHGPVIDAARQGR
jgi:hypothetical protein